MSHPKKAAIWSNTIFKLIMLSILILVGCPAATFAINYMTPLEWRYDWESQGKPPESAVEIVGQEKFETRPQFRGSDYDNVFIRTETGKIYGCNVTDFFGECWFEVEALPKVSSAMSAEIDYRPPELIESFETLPGAVVTNLNISYGPQGDRDYVLLDDGTIWTSYYRNHQPMWIVFLPIITIILAILATVIFWLEILVYVIYKKFTNARKARSEITVE
jgi:hypothetical protein